MALSGFNEVQLYKKEVIGVGAYGSVCKARCDELTCAAKILHPTLITDHPGEKSPQGRFRAECEFLSSLRHPNVVQYLGMWQDPATNLPVLLMELMDHSLTHFLEKCPQTPLPFHTQVNICHDIALALSFLHSNGIIHRDLSSNNVLMIADRRAKVTDFGMARLVDLNPKASRLSFSKCPGTDVYMPPEAVKEKPEYTEKIDCFSFGVLALQILSRQFPSPGSRVKAVVIGGRELLEPQTEFSRREEDIKMVDSTNPIFTVACDCLKGKESDRPSAKELCASISGLKGEQQYTESTEKPAKDTLSAEKEAELKSELEGLRAVIRERDARIQSLECSLNAAFDARHAEIKSLETRLNIAHKQNLDLLRETFQTAATIDPMPVTSAKNETSGPFQWTRGSNAPYAISRYSDAVVCGKFVYLRPGSSQQLLVYNWETDSWTELVHCPASYSTLANVKNTLVVIGGFDQSGKTNKLHTLTTASKNFTWTEVYPPMPTKRDGAIAACYGGYLIVAGGIGNVFLKTVEVLHIDYKQWHTGASLPSAMFSGSATICGDTLYVLGGFSAVGTVTYSVMKCLLGALIDSCVWPSSQDKNSADSVWGYGTLLPVSKPACVSFQNHLLAVGGQDKLSFEPSRKVWAYLGVSWAEFSRCEQARSQCFAAVLPGDQLMVTGGLTAKNSTGEIDSTEIARSGSSSS